jgi:hypothetical protein
MDEAFAEVEKVKGAPHGLVLCAAFEQRTRSRRTVEGVARLPPVET